MPGNPNPTPFKKTGAAANPNGRPKKAWTMRGLIEQALEEEQETGVPKKLGIARKLAQLALEGDIVAIKEVNNRIDGMPQQDITSAGEKIEGPKVILDVNARTD